MNVIIFVFAFIGASSFHAKHGVVKPGIQGQASAYFDVKDPDGSRQEALAAGINPDAAEELQAGAKDSAVILASAQR